MRIPGRAVSWVAVPTLAALAAGAGTFAAVTGPTTGGKASVSPTTAPSTVPPTTAPSTASSPSTTPTTTPQPPEQIMKVAFFDADHGDGLFEDHDVTPCSLAVASTSDGGSTFSPPMPIAGSSCASSSGGPPATSLSFDDHGDGFVFDPGLFVTHDGGATWDEVSSFEPVLSVVPLGDSVWALHGSCSEGSAPVCDFGIEESSDGGRAWSDHPLPGAGGSTSYTGLLRTSATSAFLVAASLVYQQVGQPPNDAVTLLSTTDGGESWQTVSSAPCVGRGWSIDLSQAPDGALWLVCGGQPGAGNQIKSVARSLDGGRTWVQGPCAAGLASQAFFDCLESAHMLAGYLGDLVALSDATAFVDGGRNFLQVSHDGGVAWTKTNPVIGDGDSGVGGLYFADPETGWVISGMESPEATLWRTSDGGNTWSEAWSPER